MYQSIWENIFTDVDDIVYVDFDSMLTQLLDHDFESRADVENVNHYCSHMDEEDGEPSLQPA